MFVVAGESLIDLVALPEAAGQPPHFAAHAGGSPYNCALALALLGHETGFLCPLSQDSFGDMLLGPLESAGVVPLLERRSPLPTTLAVVTRNAMGLPRYAFYRRGTAERDLDRAALTAALPARITAFQMGGFLPIEPEDAEIWLAVAAAAAGRGAVVSFDPNVRPNLVADFPAYCQRLSRFLERAHIVKVSDEDLAALDPTLDVDAHVKALLARPACRLVIVTRGEGGSQAFTRRAQARAPVYRPASFGDTVGAGDSLMAGVLSALASSGALSLDGLETADAAALEQVLESGSVVAGLNCAHVGCHPPRRAEVEAVLEARAV